MPDAEGASTQFTLFPLDMGCLCRDSPRAGELTAEMLPYSTLTLNPGVPALRVTPGSFVALPTDAARLIKRYLRTA